VVRSEVPTKRGLGGTSNCSYHVWSHVRFEVRKGLLRTGLDLGSGRLKDQP
jgi:hypothetical protein